MFEQTHAASFLPDRLIWNIQCGKFWINHGSQTFSKIRNLSVSYQTTGFLCMCGRRYDFYIHWDKASYPRNSFLDAIHNINSSVCLAMFWLLTAGTFSSYVFLLSCKRITLQIRKSKEYSSCWMRCFSSSLQAWPFKKNVRNRKRKIYNSTGYSKLKDLLLHRN